MSIAEVIKKLPESDQMYGFIVDNNALLMYHPQLILPVRSFLIVTQFLMAFFTENRSALYSSQRVLRRLSIKSQSGFRTAGSIRVFG